MENLPPLWMPVVDGAQGDAKIRAQAASKRPA